MKVIIKSFTLNPEESDMLDEMAKSGEQSEFIRLVIREEYQRRGLADNQEVKYDASTYKIGKE
jgi:hypothetical protein